MPVATEVPVAFAMITRGCQKRECSKMRRETIETITNWLLMIDLGLFIVFAVLASRHGLRRFERRTGERGAPTTRGKSLIETS